MVVIMLILQIVESTFKYIGGNKMKISNTHLIISNMNMDRDSYAKAISSVYEAMQYNFNTELKVDLAKVHLEVNTPKYYYVRDLKYLQQELDREIPDVKGSLLFKFIKDETKEVYNYELKIGQGNYKFKFLGGEELCS